MEHNTNHDSKKIQYVSISDIKEYENNPRDNTKAVEAVKKSIKKFGIQIPAILDENNVIVTGHTRIKAAHQLGYTEFPCIIANDLTKEQIKAYRLADNRIHEDSKWDDNQLAYELSSLKEDGFDLSFTCINEEDMRILIEEPEDETENVQIDKQQSSARNTNWQSFANDYHNEGEEKHTFGSAISAGSYHEQTDNQINYEENDEEYEEEYAGNERKEQYEVYSRATAENARNDNPVAKTTPEQSVVADDERFTCIVCCRNDEEVGKILEILNRAGDKRRLFRVSELIETK